MRHPWLFLLVGLAGFAQATGVYQYRDDQGNLVFTDKPPVHVEAESVHVPESNRTQMPRVTKRSTSPTEENDENNEAREPYRQLSISGLPEGGSIRANDGSFIVRVSIEPRLALVHKLQLLVDGEPHGPALRSIELPASNLDRGEHSLAIQVMAGEQVVQQSQSYPVTILRAHINAPARRGKP